MGDILRAPPHVDHWLVSRTSYGALVERTRLPTGSDLIAVYFEQRLHYHRSGWRIVGFSSTNSEFFVAKDEQRRCIAITAADPGS